MIATRAVLVRRRGLAALALALVLAFAVAWAHSGMAMDHMGAPATVCMAAVDAALVVGAAVMAAHFSGIGSPGASPTAWDLRSVFIASPTSAPVRAGPARLQVFLL